MDKIIITIKNGMIDTVYSTNKNIKVEIVDYDGYFEGQDKEETKTVNRIEEEVKKMKVLY